MRRKLFILLFTVLSAVLVMVGASACSDASINYEEEGYVKVVFHLEGGTYRNSANPVVNYYPFEAGTQNHIVELGGLSGTKPVRQHYRLDGWYRTRTPRVDMEGNPVLDEAGHQRYDYSDPWDFKKDTVSDAGVTLYAKWRANATYTYDVVFRSDEGEETVLFSYEVEEGEKFSDSLNNASNAPGYTFLGTFRDAEGNPWDPDFTHPGGEESTAIKVYPDYVKGIYSVVRTAEELKDAFEAYESVYLMNDIDMQGGVLRMGTANYRGEFRGNGHTVSNFTIGYDASSLQTITELGASNVLAISLFRNLVGATVENVTFTGYTIDVNTFNTRMQGVYVAPLCIVMRNSTVKNVTMTDGTITCSRLPNGFLQGNLVVAEQAEPYFVRSESEPSTVTNLTAQFVDRTGEYFTAASN